jgi:tetratricopeptide (TPR) repeat protein
VNRPFLFLATFLAFSAAAQDVYTPPVPIGIKRDGQTRTKRPVPFPSEAQQWIRLRTPHFDVLSSADAARTIEIARNFETFAAALSRANARFKTGTTPATVFVFGKRRDSQPYFDLLLDRDRAPATGLYVRHEDGGTMFIDAGRRIERTAMHELVHDLLRQQEAVPPLWIEEGLAEFFGNARLGDGEIYAGDLIREHTQLLRLHGPRPVEEMLEQSNASEAAASSRFYAQSWASVQYLMQIGGEERFFAFLHDVEAKMPVADALRKHYGQTTKDLFQGSRNVSARRFRIEAPVAFDVSPPAALDRATLLFELGRFLSHVSGAEEEPQRHYREALRLNPKHARSLAAVGEFDAAIAAAPDDANVRLTYAESLLTLAIGPFAGVFEPKPADDVRFRKAREVLAPVDTPIAHGFLGTTYLVETDVAPGIAHLERAPERPDFMLNLYAMYLRTAQHEKAEALYQRVLANAREEQTRFAARNVRLVAETNRANDLARNGDLDGAARVVCGLAAATPDAVARRELERQAEGLEATAAVNRHIRMYNDAIGYSNAGKKKDALRVLGELLAVATDPAVVRDAKKLQAELRR